MSVKNHSHDRYGKLASEDLVLTNDLSFNYLKLEPKDK